MKVPIHQSIFVDKLKLIQSKESVFDLCVQVPISLTCLSIFLFLPIDRFLLHTLIFATLGLIAHFILLKRYKLKTTNPNYYLAHVLAKEKFDRYRFKGTNYYKTPGTSAWFMVSKIIIHEDSLDLTIIYIDIDVLKYD